MTLKILKKTFNEALFSVFPKTEIDTFFILLIEEYLNFQRIDTVLKADFEIPQNNLLQFEIAIKQLKKSVPIQYIIGKTEFYGLPFFVNKNTLIPRPETEELVSWILDEAVNYTKISILDIGTGTGCISISLAKNIKKLTIFALDVSEKALETAKKNALLNSVQISFSQIDILKAISLKNELKHQKIDILVSNPPYVRNLEKKEIQKNVLENEPHLALFVKDNNPLIFYDKIAEIAKKSLNDNGLLFFEINQYLGNETVHLLEKKGFSNIEVRKDIFGNDRMIKASFISD